MAFIWLISACWLRDGSGLFCAAALPAIRARMSMMAAVHQMHQRAREQDEIGQDEPDMREMKDQKV